MLYSMLKPPSHKIMVSRIRCHVPLWIRWPRWISTFQDFGPSTFQDSRNLRIPHFNFPEMTFSMVQIWCHTSCWIERLLLILGFRGSDLLQKNSTTFWTPDSCSYYLPSISKFWHEKSFFPTRRSCSFDLSPYQTTLSVVLWRFLCNPRTWTTYFPWQLYVITFGSTWDDMLPASFQEQAVSVALWIGLWIHAKKTSCWGLKANKQTILKRKEKYMGSRRTLFMYIPRLIDFYKVIGEKKIPP